MISALLTRDAVILLAIAAAALVTAGSWLRGRRSRGGQSSRLMIRIGYLLFGLSVILFIVVGFRSG